MEDKKFSGKGACKYGKASYTGEFVEGKRQGRGKMVFENFDTYEGDWLNGEMDGFGTYKFWDKSKDQFSKQIYDGQFKHGVREGVGIMKYSNGDVYNGNWQNNYRTGDGICYFADGCVFQGLWKFDKMIRGVFRRPNGEIYDGEIKNGRFEGYGKYYWPNGKWFEGIFVQNKLYTGMLFTMDGKISEYKEGQQQ